jgi:hypothetical protein
MGGGHTWTGSPEFGAWSDGVEFTTRQAPQKQQQARQQEASEKEEGEEYDEDEDEEYGGWLWPGAGALGAKLSAQGPEAWLGACWPWRLQLCRACTLEGFS